MAVRKSWNIHHRCGRSVDHDLSNRPAEKRAGFARWLTGKECTDCWKAAQEGDGTGKEE